jgi:MOB kinase activator 1
MAADPNKRKKKGNGGGDHQHQHKPVKHKNKKRLELYEYAQATLGAGNIREAVKKPDGEDLNEWLAVNTVDFFNEISLLYGIVTEYCTKEQCPVMSAGPKYEYLWADGKKVKNQLNVVHQNILMHYLHGLMNK